MPRSAMRWRNRPSIGSEMSTPVTCPLRAGAATDIEHLLARPGLRFAQDQVGDLDVARLLYLGPLHPTGPRDLIPIAPHRVIGGIGGSSRVVHSWSRSSRRYAVRPSRPLYARHLRMTKDFDALNRNPSS